MERIYIRKQKFSSIKKTLLIFTLIFFISSITVASVNASGTIPTKINERDYLRGYHHGYPKGYNDGFKDAKNCKPHRMFPMIMFPHNYQGGYQAGYQKGYGDGYNKRKKFCHKNVV